VRRDLSHAHARARSIEEKKKAVRPSTTHLAKLKVKPALFSISHAKMKKPGYFTRSFCIIPWEDAPEHAIYEDVYRFGFEVKWWSIADSNR